MKRRSDGSLIRRPDGRWFARLRYTDAAGRPREKKRACPTYAHAKAMLRQLANEIDTERTTADRATYDRLDERYRDQYVHAARFVGGKKIDGFRQPLNIVRLYLDAAKNHFGTTAVDAIDAAALRRYRAALVARPTRHGRERSVSDINQHLRRLRRVLAYGVELGMIDINPFQRCSGVIVESHETHRTRVISTDEELRLLEACRGRPDYLRPLIIAAIETGARRGELQRLRWADVDLTRRTITIHALNTKTLRPRTVPVTARLRDELARHRGQTLRPNSLVFGVIDFKRAFATARRLAKGIDDVHFHDLRHTAITRMIEAGIPAEMVMKISGHTQHRTFMRYLNQSPDTLAQVADILDRVRRVGGQ